MGGFDPQNTPPLGAPLELGLSLRLELGLVQQFSHSYITQQQPLPYKFDQYNFTR